MLPAVMDVCPELFSPEQRAVNDNMITTSTTTNTDDAASASGAIDGQKKQVIF